MLSLFPQFLAYQFFSPFILRIVLGVVFISFGYTKFKDVSGVSALLFSLGIKPAKFWTVFLAILEIVVGILFIIGFIAQVAAILASLIIIGAIFTVARVNKKYTFYIILLAISLSLIISGPGAFAIDLPL